MHYIFQFFVWTTLSRSDEHKPTLGYITVIGSQAEDNLLDAVN